MPRTFDWDENNQDHLAEHGVTPEEAEQVIFNGPIDLELQLRKGEQRLVQLGRTDTGRTLVVVTTERRAKIRVVTAFPANKKLRNIYEQKGQEGFTKAEDA